MSKVNSQVYSLRKDEEGNIITTKMVQNHGNMQDLFEYLDESDRSLHTNLTPKFLELFYKLTEDDTSQIIATTQDSNLLDLDLVRQDEIWFVKRRGDHSSNLY